MNADLRYRIVDLAYRWKRGHIPSALSIVDTIDVLYSSVMKYRCDDPVWPDRDYFILSKGHGALALYAALEKHGVLTLDARQPLPEHPEMGTPGIEAATGSLGHGLPMAVGLALGLRMRGRSGHVFCLVGDGECNEGSVWEAALLAAHLELDNLTCIVDDNRSSLLHIQPFFQRWLAFGWEVAEVGGHDRYALARQLSYHDPCGPPQCVIASTVKGKGLRAMEQAPGQWHHRVPTDEEYALFMKELG